MSSFKSYKNKFLTLFFLTAFPFPFLNSNAAPLILNSDQNFPYVFTLADNATYDSITVSDDVTIQQIVLEESVNLTSFTNRGTLTDGISFGNATGISVFNNYGTMPGFYSGFSNVVPVINNFGTIGALNFDSEGQAATVTNSGLILPNEFGSAIRFGNAGNPDFLFLNPGSEIIGNIQFGNSDEDRVTIGSGVQETRVYHYTGNFILNPYDTDTLIVTISDSDHDNKTFTVMSSFTVEDSSLYDSLSASIDIGNLIAARLSKTRSDRNAQNSEVKVALNDNKNSDAYSALGVKFNEHQTFYWSEVFGSYDERSAYKSKGNLEVSTGGILFGADKAISFNQRLGGFIGALNGATDIAGGPNNKVLRNIDSKGIFAGGYLSTNNKPYFMDVSLVSGLVENDSNRLVGSTEVARSSYNNIFFTPSVTIGKSLNLKKHPVVVSATLRYTGQIVETSKETGSSANIKTDGRYFSAVSSRVQIETDNKGKNIAGGNFEINYRAGLEGNRVIGNQNIDLTINGQNIALNSNNRKYNVDGFVGVSTSYDLKENVRIYADIEGTKGITKSLSNNDLGLYGKLGLKFGF